MKILVALPDNRFGLGQWSLLDDDEIVQLGPYAADGKADNAMAAAKGNPTRDPKKQFGDTPLGEYEGKLSFVPDTPENRRAYGLPDDSKSIPVIHLKPISGDGLTRQQNEDKAAGHHVEMGLLIHAGPPNAQNQLRSTHGCLRVWGKDFSLVVPVIKACGAGFVLPVSIILKP